MSQSCESFEEAASEAAARVRRDHGHANRPLSIAVLGPKISSVGGPYGKKRRQIFQSLKDMGHDPFYPETRLDPASHWARSELAVLASSDVDLVIILQAPESFGVVGEVVAYSLFSDILGKAAVFTPGEYYTPDESFAANSASFYPVHVEYTDQHFRECRLLEECREIVANFIVGNSPLVRGFDF